jgi:DNA-binding response OmpR family regulator
MPVIMMTGMKDSLHHRKAESLRVSDYLVKNEFTMPELIQHIRRHLEKASASTHQPI